MTIRNKGLTGAVLIGAILVVMTFFLRYSSKPQKVHVVTHETRVSFKNFGINGEEAHFILDTGDSTNLFFSSAIERLGVNYAISVNKKGYDLSDMVYFTASGHIFQTQLPVSTYALNGIDGLIGWPAVRNNILVFDGNQHLVRATAELPFDLTEWTKFKIQKSERLILETTLPNGKNGNILVDTGASFGVFLSPSLWKEWIDVHPKFPLTAHSYIGPGVGSGIVMEAKADIINLGSLALTNVPVCNGPSSEVVGIDNYICTIGLLALEHMDLIVDGKNSIAYVRPRSSNLEGANWKVDDSVLLNIATFNIDSAEVKFENGNTEGAIADLNIALTFNQNDFDVIIYLGAIKESKGDYIGAITDFTHAIDINPSYAIAHYRRAIAKELKGDFEGAVTDYSESIRLEPNSARNSYLHRQLLLRRLNYQEGDFDQIVTNWQSSWAKTIGMFLGGEISDSELLFAASSGSEKVMLTQQCEAYYFIGMEHLLKGNYAEAGDFFKKCTSLQVSGVNDSLLLARSELQRLNHLSPK